MNNNCNLTTCRYNADGKCTNEEKREECVRVSKAVLSVDSYSLCGIDEYSTDVKPTVEPLAHIRVSVLYNGIKETKWIDCVYKTMVNLNNNMIYGMFSKNGDKLNEKRILKWKYR